MSTLHQLKHGLERTWESLSEGWHYLQQRASHALTRFQHTRGNAELQTADEQFLRHTANWGLLAAEVQESATSVRVTLEIPGMEPDQFDIEVINNNTLVVRGEKRARREADTDRYHVMECAYGSFERAIPLPTTVNEADTSAKYRNGVLRITLPKTPAAIARKIEVTSS